MIGRELPAWVSGYVGLAFADHGRGPSRFDCWGLVRHVLQTELRLPPLPDHGAYAHVKHAAGVAAMFREGLAAAWHRVEDASQALGDIAVFRRATKGAAGVVWVPHHVGLIVARDHMLHIEKGTDSVVERFDRQPWSNHLEGLYRHHSLLGGDHG